MVHGVSSQVMDGFQELSFTMTPFMVLEVTRLFIQQVFMGVPGPKSPLVPLLIWLTGMGDCMVLEPTVESIGRYQMVHGVSSQVVDGFQELSFMVTPLMVSEVTRLFIQQVFMGVPGPKSPLVALLIWLTGMVVCMVLGPTKQSIGLYPMVHGVNSQVVDWFHKLSFMTISFMVSELTRPYGQQVFMGVHGQNIPLVALLIWLTGSEIETDSLAQFLGLKIHEIDLDLIRKLP